jgi:hypothetical protein
MVERQETGARGTLGAAVHLIAHHRVVQTVLVDQGQGAI